MSFPEKVKSTLLGIVDSMALDPAPFVQNPGKDFTRNRKLGFAQMLRLLLSMESGCLGHEPLKIFQFDSDSLPSVPAFIQQRAKLRPEAFRYLLERFHLSFPTKKYLGKYALLS